MTLNAVPYTRMPRAGYLSSISPIAFNSKATEKAPHSRTTSMATYHKWVIAEISGKIKSP
jgi:hypothetical protein